MTIDEKDMINSILESVSRIDYIKPEDIPNIDLYMDQVTTYLNDKFANTKRHEDDKLMTKTMINNYVKSRLLPSPEKKKYTKDHMMVLIMIYFFKNIISINDVNKLITPLLDSYFHNDEIPLENIINTFLTFAKQCNLTDSILTEYNECREIFKDANVKDKEYLETMGLITMLSYDTFVRKIVIEKLIDSLPDTENNEK